MSFSETCRKLNLSSKELRELLFNAGYYYVKDRKNIVKSAIIKYKEASEKFITLGVEHTTFTEVAKEFGLNPQRLRDYISQYYPNTKLYKDYYCNDHVFDSIDTEEKAYWLGFIFADGYISSSPLIEGKVNEYAFELALSIKDIDHLEKFKIFCDFSKKISANDIRCKIKINSKNLWNTLNNYGCTPNKSLTLEFPNENIFKDKSLIRHFIRGYFDGDGCFTYSDSEHLRPETSLLGTKQFLTKVSEYLNIPQSYIYNAKKLSGQTYTLNTYTRKYISKILNLYKDSEIYLTRKYEKYLEFCRLYEESYRGLEGKIGEGCDANTEITVETKESTAS